MRFVFFSILIASLLAAGCAHPKLYLPVPATAPAKGPANVLVIQEAGDFQCPFCARAQPAMKEVLATYGNRVRVVWRNYPLPMHPDAMRAAEAAMEVRAQGGDAKFWAYHDVLFAHQAELQRENLERYAEELGGIDMVRFRRTLDEHVHRAAIDADVEAIRRAAGNVGAPTFFIGDRVLEGMQPAEVLREAIDSELGR